MQQLLYLDDRVKIQHMKSPPSSNNIIQLLETQLMSSKHLAATESRIIDNFLASSF